MDKKQARSRRSRKTRVRIALQRATRLVVSRSNCHIYAQIIAPEGDRVLASASTLEADVRRDGKSGGNKTAAELVGARFGSSGARAFTDFRLHDDPLDAIRLIGANVIPALRAP